MKQPEQLVAAGSLRDVLGALVDLGPAAASITNVEVAEAPDGTVTVRAQLTPEGQE